MYKIVIFLALVAAASAGLISYAAPYSPVAVAHAPIATVAHAPISYGLGYGLGYGYGYPALIH